VTRSIVRRQADPRRKRTTGGHQPGLCSTAEWRRTAMNRGRRQAPGGGRQQCRRQHGGGLALSKRGRRPAIRAKVFVLARDNANFENASYDEFAEGHFLTRPMMKWFWDAYTTNPASASRSMPHLLATRSTAWTSAGSDSTAEKDVPRDEGEAYAANWTPPASRSWSRATTDDSRLWPSKCSEHGARNAGGVASGLQGNQRAPEVTNAGSLDRLGVPSSSMRSDH